MGEEVKTGSHNMPTWCLAVAKPLGASWVMPQVGRSCPLVWVPAGSLQPCPSPGVLLCYRETPNSAGLDFLDQPFFLFLKLAQRGIAVFTCVSGKGGSLGRVSSE